jgi:2-polyprenyl-6-methoxyphenol hydroxylase-like FAD-dependent oxidoreductase
MKAIIIGAGIGGLTTAIALQKVGIEVTVYERAAQLKAVGAGLSLWANALRAFDYVGVGDAVRRSSLPGLDAGFHAANGQLLSSTSGVDLAKHFGNVPLVVVHRGELMDILLQKAGNVVRCGCAFDHFEQDEGGVTVYFADGSADSADLVIGADGIHSPVRMQLFPDSKPVYSGYTAWRSVVHFDHARVGNMWGESWGMGKRVGLLPLPDNRIYWFATANRPEREKLSPEQNKSLLLEMFADWHHPIAELFSETPADMILHNDIVDIDPLPAWYDGRVVLLGDAVHAMTPNMGQGACQAVEDAVILARALITSTALETGLARYAAARQTRTKVIQLQSRRIGCVGQLENPLLCWLRNQAVKLTPPQAQLNILRPIVGYDVAQVTI